MVDDRPALRALLRAALPVGATGRAGRAGLYLGWAFDYLPHTRLHAMLAEDRLRTARNRVGGERLLSPLLLFQNDHLVHHLHPVVPFYRYLAVWRRNEDRYLEGGAAVSTVRGRELTPKEHRRLRDLVDRH